MQANVDETLRQLKSQGIEAAGCAANVGKPAHLQALVDLAIEQYSKIDILVSNAAVNPAAGDILDMPESAIDKVLDVNIKSAIILAQLVRPHLPLASPTRLACKHMCANARPAGCIGKLFQYGPSVIIETHANHSIA